MSDKQNIFSSLPKYIIELYQLFQIFADESNNRQLNTYYEINLRQFKDKIARNFCDEAKTELFFTNYYI